MPKTRSSSKKIESIQTKTAEYLKSKDLTFAQLQCFAEKLNMKKIKKHYKKEIYITKIVSASALQDWTFERVEQEVKTIIVQTVHDKNNLFLEKSAKKNSVDLKELKEKYAETSEINIEMREQVLMNRDMISMIGEKQAESNKNLTEKLENVINETAKNFDDLDNQNFNLNGEMLLNRKKINSVEERQDDIEEKVDNNTKIASLMLKTTRSHTENLKDHSSAIDLLNKNMSKIQSNKRSSEQAEQSFPKNTSTPYGKTKKNVSN